MKLTKTNKFKIKIDTPWTKMSEIVENGDNFFGIQNFPELYEPLYQFEDGTLVSINDTVYRIKTEGYNRIIKSIKLMKVHIDGELEVFPNIETANKKLKEEENQASVRIKESSEKNILNTIKILTNIKDFDKLTLYEIKLKLEQINKLVQ